jgi:catechol 2,3-dioxygenase-like lactoylglutathione lyase family enzyme
MVPTFGLTHIALAVSDVERPSRFYHDVFGAVEVYRHAEFAQLQAPGTRDVLVLEHAPDRAGQGGGITHFGFRLTTPSDIDLARQAVEAAGGKVREQGEFVAGEPYLFALDPGGWLPKEHLLPVIRPEDATDLEGTRLPVTWLYNGRSNERDRCSGDMAN